MFSGVIVWLKVDHMAHLGIEETLKTLNSSDSVRDKLEGDYIQHKNRNSPMCCVVSYSPSFSITDIYSRAEGGIHHATF